MAKQFYVDQLKDKNIIAFLKLIRFTEGTSGVNGYRMLFGGGLFNDFSKHPNIVVNKSGYKSSAAGAYQILADTWNNQVKKGIGVSDFSEKSQDLGAVYLINIQGKALDLVKQGKFYSAVHLCAKIWASFPVLQDVTKSNGITVSAGRSYYGQPAKDINNMAQYFTSQGGTINEDPNNLSIGGAAAVGDGTNTDGGDLEKQKLEELKKKIDLDAFFLNQQNLEQHQVNVSWGSRLNASENSDWLGLKQFILYLCNTFVPNQLVPFAELIPKFTIEGNAQLRKRTSDENAQFDNTADLNITRYNKMAENFETLKNSGGIDLLTQDPFLDIVNYESNRGLTFRTVGMMTYNATDSGSLSKPGAVGVQSIEVQVGDPSLQGAAMVTIVMEDAQGNKFLDPASPWSIVLNKAQYGGDFWFRFGWQLTLPQKTDSVNSSDNLFWNHPGWQTFGYKVRDDFYKKVKNNNFVINLTQNLSSESLAYNGYNIVKENGKFGFVKELITDVTTANNYYLSLNMMMPTIAVDPVTNSIKATLVFQTTADMSNFMCQITQSENIKQLVESAAGGQVNLYDMIIAFLKDNNKAIESIEDEKEKEARKKELFNIPETDTPELRSALINVSSVVQLQTTMNAEKLIDPKSIIITVTPEMISQLSATNNNNQTLWSWVVNTLSDAKNGLTVSPFLNPNRGSFNFLYDGGENLLNKDLNELDEEQVMLASGYLTSRNVDRLFTSDEVYAKKFQGTLVTELAVEQVDDQTQQSIQANVNQAASDLANAGVENPTQGLEETVNNTGVEGNNNPEVPKTNTTILDNFTKFNSENAIQKTIQGDLFKAKQNAAKIKSVTQNNTSGTEKNAANFLAPSDQLFFIGDSIANGYKLKSKAKGLILNNGQPNSILSLVNNVLSNASAYKDKVIYLSTGISYNEFDKPAARAQLEAFKNAGIKVNVFGVSSTFHNGPQDINNYLRNQCFINGHFFLGSFESGPDNINPKEFTSLAQQNDDTIILNNDATAEQKAQDLVSRAIQIAFGFQGTKETSHNSGPQVDLFLNSVGLNPGLPWCMAFVYYCFNKAAVSLAIKNPLKKTGSVLDQWNSTAKQYKTSSPKVGSVFIIDYGGDKGHTGIVTSVNGDGTISTIEGNTSASGSREGDSVWIKKRKISAMLGFITFSSIDGDNVLNNSDNPYVLENVQKNTYDTKTDSLRTILARMRNIQITTLGLPWLQLGTSFYVKGEGNFDGKYYYTKLVHTIENNQFLTKINGVSVIMNDSLYSEYEAQKRGETLETTTMTPNITSNAGVDNNNNLFNTLQEEIRANTVTAQREKNNKQNIDLIKNKIPTFFIK